MNKHTSFPPKESLFEIIYRLAKIKDEETLAQLIKAGNCVDIYRNHYSPVALLAKEGEHEAVNFLINKFNATPNFAIVGYAQGGYIEQVNALLAQGANLNSAVVGYAQEGYIEQVNVLLAQGASLNYAVWGYARGGHIKQVNALLDQGAGINSAVWGYALGGHIEQVNALLVQGASLNSTVCGYALGGYIEQVNALIALGASLNSAVVGYARGGYIEQVNVLLGQKASLNSAVWSYALGGHIEQVNALLAQGASLNSVVSGYARGGHIEQVNALLVQGASLNSAVFSYARGGYIEQVNALLVQGANPIEALGGYLEGDHVTQESLLRLMALTDNNKLRELFVGEVKKQNWSIDASLLLKKSSKINQLIRGNCLSFVQACNYIELFSPVDKNSIKEAVVWEREGQQLVAQEIIPEEIYSRILSYVTGTSEKNNREVFATIENRRVTFFAEKRAKEEHDINGLHHSWCTVM